MDLVKFVFDRLCTNTLHGNASIDIMEHLPTLYKYAKECDSVFETGVRGCVSSWAFLYGLLDGTDNSKPKMLFLNDIQPCNIDELLKANNNCTNKVDIKYEWKNNLLLDLPEKYDITFIDTWHIYGQLVRELNKFSKITNKYIIMHDTTVDEIFGETIRCGWNAGQQSAETNIPVEEITKGLGPAIDDFLKNNPDWYLKEKYTNNNGLTILAKKSI
jgi:hypothetical protein